MARGTLRLPLIIGGTLAALIALSAQPFAQGAAPPKTPRAAALVDLTGYWVALVTEDWRYRMTVGAKGDFPGIPLNAEGRKVGNMWDPARPSAPGEECKPYGAAGIMRVPTRLRVTWEGEDTLKMETDAGTQTRLFHFGAPPPAASPDWQGTSVASWDLLGGRGGSPRAGGLKVITTNMRPGYLRWNGPPYSANAVMTEFFDVVTGPDGTQYMVVTSVLEDPTYLNLPLIFSPHFKKQIDASGWNPTPCMTPSRSPVVMRGAP